MILDVIRVIAGIIFLGYASYTDLKTRKVDDKTWVIMGFAGLMLVFGQLYLENRNPVYYLTFIPIMLLFLSFFLETAEKTELKKGKINRRIWIVLCCFGTIIFIWLSYKLRFDAFFLHLLTIPLIMLFAFLLYNIRLLFGGADAKALITIALLTPFYPEWTPFLGYFSVPNVWPFPLAVLTNALILSLAIPIVFFVYNTARKDFHFPLSFLGYKIDIDSVEKKFVWPMEKVKNGKIIKLFLPKKDENTKEEVRKLKEAGVKRLWVTSKIPFMLPLFTGFITSFLVGDIMFKIVRMIWGI